MIVPPKWFVTILSGSVVVLKQHEIHRHSASEAAKAAGEWCHESWRNNESFAEVTNADDLPVTKRFELRKEVVVQVTAELVREIPSAGPAGESKP